MSEEALLMLETYIQAEKLLLDIVDSEDFRLYIKVAMCAKTRVPELLIVKYRR